MQNALDYNADESARVCGGRCLSRLGFGRIRFRMIVIVAGLGFDRWDVVDGAVETFGGGWLMV